VHPFHSERKLKKAVQSWVSKGRVYEKWLFEKKCPSKSRSLENGADKNGACKKWRW